jgi:sugar lactone lactonase YvrE
MNNLHISVIVLAAAVMLASCSGNSQKSSEQAEDSTRIDVADSSGVLEQVFVDSTYQLTGVAISPEGRLFVNYPYWLDKHSYSVVEVSKDQKRVLYPDAAWNSFKKGDRGSAKFVCVQAVVADEENNLWIVDPAGIGLADVYQNSNKLVQIDLTTNKIKRIYTFPEKVAGPTTYINDIRLDRKNGFGYLTSSSNGGIVVINLKTGASRFVLHGHPSTLSDPAYHFTMNGKELNNAQGIVKINSDGIALSPDKAWLYYKPLTDNRLYRVSTDVLRDFGTTEEQIENKVEDLGKYVATDGMEMDADGNLYMGDLENSRIVKITPDKKMITLVQDKERLCWPDSYSISKDGYLYISCSQIHQMPWFNKNQNLTQYPYQVFRLKITNKL